MNWQDIAALTIVLIAAVYLGRQAWLMMMRKRAGGCGGGGCGSCPSGSDGAANGKPLVTIGEIRRAPGEPGR